MMNYLAKFSIAKCDFTLRQRRFQDSDIAYIGIFELSLEGIYELDLSKSSKLMHIVEAINVESWLGGGIGFPSREMAFEIMADNHTDLIKAFIGTIRQEKIVLFDDGERYAPLLMELVLECAKSAGKAVTCISPIPARFEGRNRRKFFDNSWGHIVPKADEAITYDLSYLCEGPKNKSLTVQEAHSLRRYGVIQKIQERWKEENGDEK
ncbi:MAG: hypothetical protein U9R26_07575 [Campylobacterota bacterium]|nr:hypothetical protein [Campylobacterota bacterium]